METFDVFCANDQEVIPHLHLPDPNNEVVLKCTYCGRVLKFPVGLGKSELEALIQEHESENKGKVPVDKNAKPDDPLPVKKVQEVKKARKFPWF